MIKIYLNTVDLTWYDADGSLFADGQPQIPFKNTETVAIQCCSETPNSGNAGIDPETDWSKDTQFAVPGVTALLSTDNNFTRHLSGKLHGAVESGSIASITLNINNATLGAIPPTGSVRLFDAEGDIEGLEYTARSISGTEVTFTLAEGSSLTKSYANNDPADCPESLYAQAAMDAEASDPATGLFVFTITMYSEKLRETVDYANVKNVGDVKGLELLIFTVNGNATQVLKAYTTDTFSIPVTMADPNPNPDMPETFSDSIAVMVDALLAHGFSVQFSVDGSTSWHNTQTTSDKYFRFRSTSGAGTWSVAIALPEGAQGQRGIPGIQGEPGEKGDTGPAVSIQYSADGANWHNTYQLGDIFIRFSTDEGSTWGLAMQFVGDDAPAVKIQYSATGGAGLWHDTYAATDYYLQFSVDDGTTWGSAMQFKAYPVKLQYGETASAQFHDTFVVGSDKYVKFSSDNGTTWSTAFKFIGDDGQSFVPSATGTYANISTYDDEAQGFSYLVTSGTTNEGKIYFKTSDTSGAWSSGLQFTPYGLSLQYSADGTSWHTTAATSDKYIRFSVDGGTSWSAAAQFMGKSTYIYTAYASDSSGNDFSLTRTSALDYWNWIYSENVIPVENLTLQTFTELGSGWTLYQGDDGITYDWLSGTTAPDNSLGKNGDWYINTATCDVYTKSSGSWVLKMNIQGQQGVPGQSFNPDARGLLTEKSQYDAEVKGFAFLDIENGNIYFKLSSTSGDWSNAIPLVGPQGPTGPAGTLTVVLSSTTPANPVEGMIWIETGA